MAVTFANTSVTYNTASSITASTPSGSGGVLVVVTINNGGTPAPNTPGDWTALSTSLAYGEAELRAWATDVASPDMAFNFGTLLSECGAFTWRIDNGTMTDLGSASSSSAFNGTADLPDVTGTADGVLIAVAGDQSDLGVSSTSLGLTERFDQLADTGDFVAWVTCLDSGASDQVATSGTVDAGTITWTTSDEIATLLTVVVPVVADVVQNLTVTTVSSTELDLDWDAVAGAVSYDVEREGAVVATGVLTNSYSDSGLLPGTEYEYRVRACFSGG